LGTSLASHIESGTLTTAALTDYIKLAAKKLVRIHYMRRQLFRNINFPKNYDLPKQLHWLDYNLKRFPAYKLQVVKLLKDIRELNRRTATSPTTFIHGDFQLQNLIVQNARMKVIDFDNADFSDPLTDVGNFLNQINYHNLLQKQAPKLRRAFLTAYLKQTGLRLNADVKLRLNAYIIMGIIKNVNLNSLQRNLALIRHDIKKIKFILKNQHQNPLSNLIIIKKQNG
jgi:thiamine kinase-like enzyme